jgi:hypothetical protein
MADDGTRGLDEVEQNRNRHHGGDDCERTAIEHGAFAEAINHVERLLSMRPFR